MVIRNILNNFHMFEQHSIFIFWHEIWWLAYKACYRKGLLPVICKFLRYLRKKECETSLKLKNFESSKFLFFLFPPSHRSTGDWLHP